jgi:hypothetical protein
MLDHALGTVPYRWDQSDKEGEIYSMANLVEAPWYAFAIDSPGTTSLRSPAIVWLVGADWKCLEHDWIMRLSIQLGME